MASQLFRGRFNGIVTDATLTVNAKAKLLLEEVRIFTFPNGNVTMQCVGREDVATRCCELAGAADSSLMPPIAGRLHPRETGSDQSVGTVARACRIDRGGALAVRSGY